MAKKVMALVKLHIQAGKATPAPPVGPALGQQGVNIMDFCKAFNARTSKVESGTIIPVVITVFQDRSYTFITKTPPASELIKKLAGIAKGSGEPNKSRPAVSVIRTSTPYFASSFPASFSRRSSETELIQYRKPVGAGPSSKT